MPDEIIEAEGAREAEAEGRRGKIAREEEIIGVKA